MDIFDPKLLSGNSRSIDENAILVDDIDDGSDLAVVRSVLKDHNSTDFDKLLERLEKNTTIR